MFILISFIGGEGPNSRTVENTSSDMTCDTWHLMDLYLNETEPRQRRDRWQRRNGRKRGRKIVNDTSTTPYDIIIAFTCTHLYSISKLMILGNPATHGERAVWYHWGNPSHWRSIIHCIIKLTFHSSCYYREVQIVTNFAMKLNITTINTHNNVWILK